MSYHLHNQILFTDNHKTAFPPHLFNCMSLPHLSSVPTFLSPSSLFFHLQCFKYSHTNPFSIKDFIHFSFIHFFFISLVAVLNSFSLLVQPTLSLPSSYPLPHASSQFPLFVCPTILLFYPPFFLFLSFSLPPFLHTLLPLCCLAQLLK